MKVSSIKIDPYINLDAGTMLVFSFLLALINFSLPGLLTSTARSSFSMMVARLIWILGITSVFSPFALGKITVI